MDPSSGHRNASAARGSLAASADASAAGFATASRRRAKRTEGLERSPVSWDLGSWAGLIWRNMEKYGEKKSEKSLKLSSCQVVWVHAKIAKCKGNKKYSIVYIAVASCKNR